MDIKEIINQRYAMPDASLDRLRQCLTEVSYPKGFRVLESGKIEKDIFFGAPDKPCGVLCRC